MGCQETLRSKFPLTQPPRLCVDTAILLLTAHAPILLKHDAPQCHDGKPCTHHGIDSPTEYLLSTNTILDIYCSVTTNVKGEGSVAVFANTKVGSQVQENESTRARDPTHVKRRTSAGSGSGRCGAGHLHLQRAAQELQRRMHQEPRCQPVAFAPIVASFRLTTEREQNEAEGKRKAAGSKSARSQRHGGGGTPMATSCVS